MPQKKRYKRGRQKASFTPASQALSNAETRLKEQSKTEIGGLKELQIQQREISNREISQLSSNASFQEEAQNSVFRLYDESRELIKDNSRIRADRDVARLKGIADEYEKKANHLAQLAPKQAAMYSNLITGVHDFTEALETRQLVKDLDKNKNVDWQNSESAIEAANILKERLSARVENYEDARRRTLDQGLPLNKENLIANGLLPELETQISYDKTIGKDNVAFGLKIEDQFKANKSTIVAEMHNTFKEREVTLSKANVDEWYEYYAYEYLKHKNLSPNSKSGKAIRAEFTKLARLKSISLTNKDNLKITEFQRTDLSDKLSQIKDPIRQQIYFNEAVLATKNGTFYNDRTGKYFDGPVDLKQSAIEFLSYHVKNKRTDFQSEDDVEAFVSQFVILDKKSAQEFASGTRDGVLKASIGKPLIERHPDALDTILTAWSEGQEIDAKARRSRAKADDTTNELASDKRWEEHLVNKERGYKIDEVDGEEKQIPYDKTDKQFWNNEILVASQLSKGTDKSRNYIYGKASEYLSFDRSQWTVAQRWSRIKSLELDGDHEGALAEYMQATGAQREKLRPSFERYQKIYESGWTYGANATKGIKGFTLKGNATFQAAEKVNKGNLQLSDSAKGMVPIMVSRVEEKVASIIDDPNYKGTVKQAIDLAWQEELDEFRKGENKSEPDQYGEGFYARKRQYYSEGAGSLPWFVYEHNDVSALDSDNRSILLDLRARTTDGTLAKASEEIKNLKVDEYAPETVRLLTKFGHRSYDEWLKDDSFISPHNVTKLAEVAEALADDTVGFPLNDRLDNIAVPENVKTLAYLTAKTDVEVINDLLKQNGHKVRFTADGQDAAKLINGKWVRKENVYGQTLASASMAQGIIPMREWVRSSIEDGLSVSESFKKSIGIDTYLDSEGTTVITDYPNFFQNNGLSKDPTFDWQFEFGLTGIANLKKETYKKEQLEKELLKRKAESKPIKK